jgi:hypothetical protein
MNGDSNHWKSGYSSLELGLRSRSTTKFSFFDLVEHKEAKTAAKD